ncbi:MAG: twin-arginine translocation signal domain-containing protein, partial [Candidatus Aminicenantes bacterium]|nr:twin-arginine translocation signal domain-containing protein [Candidatus Aminicenantes bacterium]
MSDPIKQQNQTGTAISRRKFLDYAASSAAAFAIVP